MTEKSDKSEKMARIADALAKVKPEINQNIWEMARSLSEEEIIQFFNQTALDFFTFAIDGTRKMGKEREYGFAGYMRLFESALGMNKIVPIDQFTVIILEFAPEIYDVKDRIISLTSYAHAYFYKLLMNKK